MFHINSLKPFVKKREVIELDGGMIQHQLKVRSSHLGRKVLVDIFLPPNYQGFRPHFYPSLIINDGQDMGQLKLVEALKNGYDSGEFEEVIVIAVHAGERLQEYGTAGIPDYMNRGSRATQYSHFVIRELIPYVYKNFRCLKDADHSAIAGFSLGGLTAMDIAWQHPRWFSKVGVLAGLFGGEVKAWTIQIQMLIESCTRWFEIAVNANVSRSIFKRVLRMRSAIVTIMV